ncbi:helix-turn-helix domain-containing protein [Coraliomargarita sp. W4R72]
MYSLCQLRSTIEAFAIRQWRENNKTNKPPEKVTAYLEELRKTAVRSDFEGFYKIDALLHRELILSVSLEPLLQNWDCVVASLSDWIFQVQKVYWPSLMALYREHLLLIEAWGSTELWIAEEATHQHLASGWHRRAAAEENFETDVDPVDRAVSFMSTHFASELDVDWIAKNVSFISTSHLSRLFREKMGQSPYAFLKQVRLERAAMLLRSIPDKISIVAQQVGYKNVSHFVRDFRAQHHTTPLRYRKADIK